MLVLENDVKYAFTKSLEIHLISYKIYQKHNQNEIRFIKRT